jgi:hypothetical protein
MWRVSGEERGVHRVLVGKPEGKSPLGRPRRRWEDNIKMDVEEGCSLSDATVFTVCLLIHFLSAVQRLNLFG